MSLLFYSMIAAFFAQLAVLYAPPLQWVFRTVPLTAPEWLRIIAASLTVLVAVEIDKWLRRRKLMLPAERPWKPLSSFGGLWASPERPVRALATRLPESPVAG